MQVDIQANEYDLWQHKTNENIMRYSNRYKLSYKILFKDLGSEDYQNLVINYTEKGPLMENIFIPKKGRNPLLFFCPSPKKLKLFTRNVDHAKRNLIQRPTKPIM